MEISDTSPFSMEGRRYNTMNTMSATTMMAVMSHHTVWNWLVATAMFAGFIKNPARSSTPAIDEVSAGDTLLMNSMPTGTHVDHMATAMKRCLFENHSETAVGPVTEHIPTPMPVMTRNARNVS